MLKIFCSHDIRSALMFSVLTLALLALGAAPVRAQTNFTDGHSLLRESGETAKNAPMKMWAAGRSRSMMPVTAATYANCSVLSFGDDRAPIIFGSYAPSQRYQEGFPLGGMWAQRVQRDRPWTTHFWAGTVRPKKPGRIRRAGRRTSDIVSTISGRKSARPWERSSNSKQRLPALFSG